MSAFGDRATIKEMRAEIERLRLELAEKTQILAALMVGKPPLRITGKDPLTARQQEVLDFMRIYQAQHQRPPTQREIALGFNLTSVNAISGHIKALALKGWIERVPNTARGINVLP